MYEKLITVVAGVLFLKFTCGFVYKLHRIHYLKETSEQILIRNQKKDAIAKQITIAQTLSKDLDQSVKAAILEATASEIVYNITIKKIWTCEIVLLAFMASACDAHLKTNCLVDFFPEEALQKAKRIDSEFLKSGKIVGVLHGVPISVKDVVKVKGYGTMMGLSKGYLGFL